VAGTQRNDALLMIKREAQKCNIKLTELGKSILKGSDEERGSIYVIKYNRKKPGIGGLKNHSKVASVLPQASYRTITPSGWERNQSATSLPDSAFGF